MVRFYRGGMDTNTTDSPDPFDNATPGENREAASDSPDVPVTAAGERSTSIEKDDDAGILPTPEPTEGGAPAP